MKILYIHQYFRTPREPGGTRSYWISQELVKRGHNVVMLTTKPDQHLNKEEELVDGIRVISFSVPYNQSMSVLQRLRAFSDFMLQATKEGMKHSDIDLIIATSTPLTVGYPALRIKRKLKVPYIFEVRDLWPEVPIQMGVLNNKILQRFARWFEKKIYINASHVIALSPGMQEGVTKYISKDRTTMIPNMAKIDEFWPRKKDNSLILELGLRPETFKAIHFGSLGVANGARYIVDAASKLRENSDIDFIFAGGGSMEKQLKFQCEELGLNNVHFLGRFPMAKISEIVNFCDVSLVSFLDVPILYTNSPNKLFDSLSAGKPILVNSNGWTRTLVETENCGYYVDPKEPQQLADKIMFLHRNPNITDEMGKNARGLAETKYDKSFLCKQFADVIEDRIVKSNLNSNTI